LFLRGTKPDQTFGFCGIFARQLHQQDADLAHVLDQFNGFASFSFSTEKNERWIPVSEGFEVEDKCLPEADEANTYLVLLVQRRIEITDPLLKPLVELAVEVGGEPVATV
jgi:hypothetical protein